MASWLRFSEVHTPRRGGMRKGHMETWRKPNSQKQTIETKTATHYVLLWWKQNWQATCATISCGQTPGICLPIAAEEMAALNRKNVMDSSCYLDPKPSITFISITLSEAKLLSELYAHFTRYFSLWLGQSQFFDASKKLLEKQGFFLTTPFAQFCWSPFSNYAGKLSTIFPTSTRLRCVRIDTNFTAFFDLDNQRANEYRSSWDEQLYS